MFCRIQARNMHYDHHDHVHNKCGVLCGLCCWSEVDLDGSRGAYHDWASITFVDLMFARAAYSTPVLIPG